MDDLIRLFIRGRLRRAERHLNNINEMLSDVEDALHNSKGKEMYRLGTKLDIIWAFRELAKRRYKRVRRLAYDWGV